jgi:hypothetical protein
MKVTLIATFGNLSTPKKQQMDWILGSFGYLCSTTTTILSTEILKYERLGRFFPHKEA